MITASTSAATDSGLYLRTQGQLGIGTNNPTSKLDVVGDAKISGVVTATSFEGDGSNLSGIGTQTNFGAFDNLVVAGVSTFNSNINVADSILHTGDTGTSGIDFVNNALRLDSGGTMRLQVQLNQIQVRNSTRFQIIPQLNSGTSFLDFGKPSDFDIGGISYAHTTDTMSFRIDTSNIADFNKSG